MLHRHIQRLGIQSQNENEFISIMKLANSKWLVKNIINQICIKRKVKWLEMDAYIVLNDVNLGIDQ